MHFRITDLIDASVASSVARSHALSVGFDSRASAELAIAVRELATNLVRHATPGGTLELNDVPEGLQVVSLDRGPGMTDPLRLLDDRPGPVDNPSHGLGQGGGAIRRLMDKVVVRNRDGGGLEVAAWKLRAGERSR